MFLVFVVCTPPPVRCTPVSKSIWTADSPENTEFEFLRNSDAQTKIYECTGVFAMPSWTAVMNYKLHS